MSNAFGLSKVKKIIAVSSCKGGVGKSTMAAGLAWELHHRGLKVGLMDADIHGPSLPSLFDIKQAPIKSDEFKLIVPINHQGLKLMSFGFLLGDAPAVMRGPIISRYIQQLLFQVNWGELDYLIIDMPPGTGDVQLTITQSVRLNGAVIITTPQALSLVDVSRGIIMFEKVNVPILGIVTNLAYFICDGCEQKHYIFGRADLSERFGVKLLAEVPIEQAMIGHFSEFKANTHFAQMTDAVIDALAAQGKGPGIPKVEVIGGRIKLIWDNGEHVSAATREIRANCRCALCVDELSGKALLDVNKIPADIVPTEITPLGSYALAITWSDGHASGIYPYTMFNNIA